MSDEPRDQASILTDRYVAVVLGDLPNLALLLAQVPAIAAVICVIWAGSRPDDRLHMALCLSAIWLGLFNSCREIVKERPILNRERRLFLRPLPYLSSKLWVLGFLGAVQVTGLLWAVDHWVGLMGSKLVLWLALFLGVLGGTAMGLLLSALVATGDRAVALAPILMLPQVFFCKGFTPTESPTGFVGALQRAHLIEWVGRLFDHGLRVGRDVDWPAAGLDLTLLAAYILVVAALTVAVLALEEVA